MMEGKLIVCVCKGGLGQRFNDCICSLDGGTDIISAKELIVKRSSGERKPYKTSRKTNYSIRPTTRKSRESDYGSHRGTYKGWYSESSDENIKKFEADVEEKVRSLINVCIADHYEKELCVEHALKNVFWQNIDINVGIDNRDYRRNPFYREPFVNHLLEKMNNEFGTNKSPFNVAAEEHIGDNIFEPVEEMPFGTLLLYFSNKSITPDEVFNLYKKNVETLMSRGYFPSYYSDVPADLDDSQYKRVQEIVEKFSEDDSYGYKSWRKQKEGEFRELERKAYEKEEELLKKYVIEKNLTYDKEQQHADWMRKLDEMDESLKEGKEENFKANYDRIINQRIPKEDAAHIHDEAMRSVFPNYTFYPGNSRPTANYESDDNE